MAITEVKRKRTPRAKFGTGYKNEYTVEYIINTNSIMNPAIVYAEGQAGTPDPLPAPFDYYQFDGVTDTSAYCLDVELRMDGDQSGTRWTAIATFGRLPPNTTPADQPPDPLDRPPRERLEWIEASEVVEKDRNGALIANTVGDPFDALPEEPILYPVLVIDKPYATLDEVINLGLQYQRSVNSLTFRNGPPRTVKFMPIQTSEIQYAGGISFYVASLRFAYNPDTWDKQFVNRGWRYRPAVGQDPVAAVDKKTRLPVSTPVKLAADGTLLAEAATPHYVTYETYELLDYNLIGV